MIRNAIPLGAGMTLTSITSLPCLLMLIVLLVAGGTRFHRLGEQSLWYDEGVAYSHALRTLPELIPLLQRNVHVPAYFTLLGLWEDVSGRSEFALRALSAFFSILSVAWTYALGKRLYHPTAGLAAAAFVALSTFSIYYAQEARMYAMLTAIAGASMWLFLGTWRELSRSAGRPAGGRNILALGLLNALGMYTHVVYALVILAQVFLALLWLVATFRREWIETRAAPVALRALLAYALTNLLTLALFAPWISVALSQVFAQPNISTPIAFETMLRQLQGHFAFGLTFQQSMGNMGFIAYFFLLFGLILHNHGGLSWWKMLVPVSWVLVALSLYLYLELGERYLRFLLPAQMAFALWMGRGVWILWTRQTRERYVALRHLPKLAAVVACGGLLLAQWNGLPLLYFHSEFQRDDIRGLTRRIESALREDDALIVSAAGLGEVLSYYYRGAAPVYGLPTTADSATTRTQVRDIIAAHDRLHVIFYGAAEQDPEGIVEATLNSSAYEISDEWVGDLRYAQYVGPADFAAPGRVDLRFGERIVLRSYALSAASAQPGDVLQVQFTWSADTTPGTRYKVFLQLLNSDGALVAQRDSEPAGGLSPSTLWQPDVPVVDNHALLLPLDLQPGEYALIAGLYDIDNPSARLPVGEGTYFELARINIS